MPLFVAHLISCGLSCHIHKLCFWHAWVTCMVYSKEIHCPLYSFWWKCFDILEREFAKAMLFKRCTFSVYRKCAILLLHQFPLCYNSVSSLSFCFFHTSSFLTLLPFFLLNLFFLPISLFLLFFCGFIFFSLSISSYLHLFFFVSAFSIFPSSFLPSLCLLSSSTILLFLFLLYFHLLFCFWHFFSSVYSVLP